MKVAPSDLDPLQEFVSRRRQRFIESFDEHCKAISSLVDKAASDRSRGHIANLKRAAHKLSGLASTSGFSRTSARASELEHLVECAGVGGFDASMARAVVALLCEALQDDLSNVASEEAAASTVVVDEAATPVRVLLVDDHTLMRCGLRALLSAQFQGAVFGEAADAQDAMSELRKSTWDLAIIDITLPGKSGLDLLKEVKTEWPELPVLVMTGHGDDHIAVRALKAGAAGYITKESAADELVRAVNKVLAGGNYVGIALAEKLATVTKNDSSAPPHEILSDREYEVMSRIASGKTVTEIADHLALSVKTISTYRARILEKLNVSNNAEIVQYALRNGLVS